MKFEYTFRSTAADYALFYLGNTYHSMVGAVNVIFTIAMLVLAVLRFPGATLPGRILLVLLVLVFPVLQPIAIYLRSWRQVRKVNKVDTYVGFDDAGMHIEVEEHRQDLRWQDMQPCMVRRTMVVVAPDGVHAYLLTNRILGGTRDAFIAYYNEQVAQGGR